MIRIFDKNCCCCSACISACPTNSIELITHKNGYKYPVINNQTCIKCNRCSSVCPLFCNNKQEKTTPLDMSIYSENCSEHTQSSAGGFCYNFAKLFLNNGGIVYSSIFDKEDHCVSMRRFDPNQIDALEAIRGSKYVKTKLSTIFRSIREDLLSGHYVCVIAMPCEINGLNLYLGKAYENLTSISLLCGGALSSNFFNRYVNELIKKYKRPLDNINFRDKKYGPIGYLTSITIESKQIYLSPRNDAYIKILSSDFVRPSCKNCAFGPELFPSNMLVCDYHNNNKVGYKTLILKNNISSFSKKIISLMGENFESADVENVNNYIAYRGKEKQSYISDELYFEFYESLLKNGTYKTVTKYIYKKMSFKQKIRVLMPNFVKGIFYGNKK